MVLAAIGAAITFGILAPVALALWKDRRNEKRRVNRLPDLTRIYDEE